MVEEQVRAVLDRVSGWPAERQQELLRVALEIEAEIAGAPYHATPDELKAIDESLSGEASQKLRFWEVGLNNDVLGLKRNSAALRVNDLICRTGFIKK